MAEHGLSGIEIVEHGGADQAISRIPTGVTAFIGRTLKGPVNQPVAVGQFSDFQQIFGGLWQPSTLSYAVEQFFENGGRQAIIVRVVNGARPPTLTLPAGNGALRLIGVNPGSREYLRASVDYDGIGAQEEDRFNLVLQRVRTAGSELIEDQEIFRRVSILPESGRYVTGVLMESRLMRVLGPTPQVRPDRSVGPQGGLTIGYCHSNPDGDDGGPLTDYDIIGSSASGTGLFALNRSQGFDMLCIPPLARDQDIGLGTLFVAARLCREHHAMLVVDPPLAWHTARDAIDGMSTWPFRSDNAFIYFPRLLATDRLRNRLETFAPCGAAAGMIARGEEARAPWLAVREEPILRPGLRPTVAIDDADRIDLLKSGINILQAIRSSARSGLGLRTLAPASSRVADWKYLPARRLALFINASIERGTRWVVFEPNTQATWQRAREQVRTFLDSLEQEGAFAGGSPDGSYFVICDERLNTPESIAQGRFNLLYGFAISKPGDFHTFLLTHEAGMGRTRAVSANRLADTHSQRRVAWEIENAILRGIQNE